MNYTIPPKKMVIINILDILKRYTDENHKLSQKQIADILKNEYNTVVERKTIKRNIMNLIEFGYEIEYTETVRYIKNKEGIKEENSIYSDFYLAREFTDSELRLLIDSLLFNRYLPARQCKEMIKKIENLSNEHFKSRVKHIQNLPDNMPRNNQVFFTLEVLDEAISKGRKVEFTYNEYGTDKKLHPRKSEPYVINPYQMVAVNDKYYLISPLEGFYFESVDNRTFLYTETQVLEIKKRLYELEEILSDKDFVRTSKSQLVNINKIKLLKPELNRSITAVIKILPRKSCRFSLAIYLYGKI